MLPPGEVITSVILEGDAVHYRSPDYQWTEECEVGLPWRINLAVEIDIQRHDGIFRVPPSVWKAATLPIGTSFRVLNPTFFTEMKFGIGDILHDEGAPTPAHKFGARRFR